MSEFFCGYFNRPFYGRAMEVSLLTTLRLLCRLVLIVSMVLFDLIDLLVLVFLVRGKEGSFGIGAAGAVMHPSHTWLSQGDATYCSTALCCTVQHCAALSTTVRCSAWCSA